ncbi:MAG: hypothetical protein C5B50_18895 [Verrucomicrobia bacterium]|nr:MAG: hypothetical protein C5B50_18895 [Verrucomicrobiota bacterium]
MQQELSGVVTRRPKLLVLQLWGLGDLVIATPFLQAASKKYAVTLLAKPFAQDLRDRFWPEVRVVPFLAPWTAFRHKYKLWAWPWGEIFRVVRLWSERYDVGVSWRWDPRDHLLLALVRARMRIGFPRVDSQIFLTHPLARPEPEHHIYENWRVIARALGLELPTREKIPVPPARQTGEVLIHSGAGQPVRVWPLERYKGLIAFLRRQKFTVQVACDPEQRDWWLQAGESSVATPRTVRELLGLLDKARAFIGNDSGPAHLAGLSGVPTFTIFGPQLPDWFAPLHPAGEWLEGKPCPYKPCSDYCRFPVPYCMVNTSEAEVCTRVGAFLARGMPGNRVQRVAVEKMG